MTIFLFQISGLSLSSDEEDLAAKYLATIQALAVSFLYTDTSESIVISYNLFRWTMQWLNISSSMGPGI